MLRVGLPFWKTVINLNLIGRTYLLHKSSKTLHNNNVIYFDIMKFYIYAFFFFCNSCAFGAMTGNEEGEPERWHTNQSDDQGPETERLL